MKEVILSIGGDYAVYRIPGAAADDLRHCCREFCDRWIKAEPQAVKFRSAHGFSYTEADFIDYLHRLFPEQPAVLVRRLGCLDSDKLLPPEYRQLPRFHF